MSTLRPAPTTEAIIDLIKERWSPRAFDAEATVSRETLTRILEAARWAPSCMNTQPWQFILAARGTAEFEQILAALAEGNQVWAKNAGALGVHLAVTPPADKPATWVEYDLGQAAALATLQAQAEGLHAHQMGGFDAEQIAAAFELPAGVRAVAAVAYGYADSPETLPTPQLQAREQAERVRKELAEISRLYI